MGAMKFIWLAAHYFPLGIAVSGGVDSMALAKLCVELRKSRRYTYKPNFHAFIVDHRARPGSGKEANLVARRLSEIGTLCYFALCTTY